jgi:hypothetical protein
LHQRDDRRQQGVAFVGELIGRAARRAAALKDAIRGQAFKPNGENVLGYAEAFLEIAEAAHAQRGRALAAAGWSAILLSIVIFTFVDAIAGYVLVPTDAMGGGGGAFAGPKHLFDVLFLLGTTAFGAGAVLALMADMQSTAPLISRFVASIGVLAELLGVLTSVACFTGFPLHQGAGISIGLGAAAFTAIGVQIAVRSR